MYHSPDIVCLVETWLSADIADSEIMLDNYHIIRLDRDRHGGGIAFYITNSISFSVLKQVPKLEFCAINLHCTSNNICIALAYRSPSTLPNSYFDTLDNVLFDLNQGSNFSNMVLIGDLNTNVASPNFSNSVLHNTFEHFGFNLFRTGPTRVSATSISDNQWGFLPGKSTTGAVLSTLYDWEGLLDKNLEVLVAFLDIRKASLCHFLCTQQPILTFFS